MEETGYLIDVVIISTLQKAARSTKNNQLCILPSRHNLKLAFSDRKLVRRINQINWV